MSAEQPTVLPWHYDAAREINSRLNTTHYVDLASLIARHDPHATTLRLLEESLAVVTHLGGTLAMMSSPDTRWESPTMERYRKHRDTIRAHLAAHGGGK